jgi:hypothetical protein
MSKPRKLLSSTTVGEEFLLRGNAYTDTPPPEPCVIDRITTKNGLRWAIAESERLARNRRKKELRHGAPRMRSRDTEHPFDGRLKLLHAQNYTDDMLANALGMAHASGAAYHRERLGLPKHYKRDLIRAPK